MKLFVWETRSYPARKLNALNAFGGICQALSKDLKAPVVKPVSLKNAVYTRAFKFTRLSLAISAQHDLVRCEIWRHFAVLMRRLEGIEL